MVRFRKLSANSIVEYMKKICKIEKIPFDLDGLMQICYVVDGDMRKAINDLQKTAYTYKKITKENVLKICNVPDPEDTKRIIKYCINGKLQQANEILELTADRGYCLMDIIKSFVIGAQNYEKIDEILRLKLIDAIYQTKIIVSSGVRTRLQLTSMLCNMVTVSLSH